MKKIIFLLFAILGAVLILLILGLFVLGDASTNLSHSTYDKANETGAYHEFLQLSQDFNKKIISDDIPSYVSLYQTVNYEHANQIYSYRYFLFIANINDNAIVDDPDNPNKIPHLKVFLITGGEDEMIYYSAEDKDVVGDDDDEAPEYDEKALKYYFFSFPIKKNGDYRIELLSNDYQKYDELSFNHQEEELVETLTNEDFYLKYEAKEGYIKRIETAVFNELLDQHLKTYYIWVGMGFYLLFAIGLWFLFFNRSKIKFKKKVVEEDQLG